MGGMLEFAMLVIMVTLLVAWIVIYLRGRGRFQAQLPETGSLYVTGVSPRPDADGEQFVTITGNLTGPSVAGKVVYGRFVWNVHEWPAIGDYLTVAYSPRNPDNWQVVRPEARPPLDS